MCWAGFFILGNVKCLVAGGLAVWKHVNDYLRGAKLLGAALPLICAHGKKFQADSVEAVRKAAVGCVLCQVAYELCHRQDGLLWLSNILPIPSR